MNKLRLILMTCLLLAATATSATAATPECFGQSATIVGSGKIKGTSGDDVIVGRGESDTINGLGGDDLICGRGGWDTLDGGDGNDKLGGGDKSDTLSGGDGNDILRGGRMFDFLEGGPGDDKIGSPKSARNDSAIYRNATGPVTIDLTAGTATGDGSDTLVGIHFLKLSVHDDFVRGTDSREVIRDYGGGDTINLLGGNDFIYAPENDSDGNDEFDLGSGDDFFNSGAGDDFIDGGDGTDAGNAGEGTDECVKGEDFNDCES